jgi:hypothetical protein
MAFSKLNSIGYYAFKLASPDRTERAVEFTINQFRRIKTILSLRSSLFAAHHDAAWAMSDIPTKIQNDRSAVNTDYKLTFVPFVIR